MFKKKTNKRSEELGLLYNRQQSWNPKQAITLKHLISYGNLWTYINLKHTLILKAWLVCP
jgi:hypothetical protein